MRPKAGYGTRIFEGKYDPNKVFKKLRIPLTMELKSIEGFGYFNEFKKYLLKLSRKNFDVIMCFHHGTLANDPEKDNGHAVVLDKIYFEENKIRFVDPTRGPKWKVVTMKKMYEAMKAHSNKAGGFWELNLVRKK